MNLAVRYWALMLTGLAVPLTAIAQTSDPAAATSPSQSSSAPASPTKPSSAQSEAGEPRASTSPERAPAAPAEAAPAQAGPPASTRTPRAAGGSASAAGHPPWNAPAGKPGATDRLELGTATVTGDREQPKVMYIVPWKKSDIGDLSGKPMNSLLDEALAPVDRDEFKRQVMYYQVVKADASQNGASKAPAPQGEK
jgi:hypothetical protein